MYIELLGSSEASLGSSLGSLWHHYIYIYINILARTYIYIYTSADPSISMHGAETNRARCSERVATRAQRFRIVFRTSLHPSELEQRCRAPQRGRPSRPEQRFRLPQRNRASSSGHFKRPSETERARAAISSAPARPSEFGPRAPERTLSLRRRTQI